MKKIVLTFAVLSLGVGLLCAGPEPLPSGKEMKQVAPAPPPTSCFNWAGFYVGAFGGYKFNSVDLDLSLGGDWNTIPAGRDFVLAHAPNDLDHSGAEAGGLLGYNFQWGCWVLGLEADGGYLWARDSDFEGFFANPPAIGSFDIRTSFKTHYLLTVAPRFGYAIGRWLPYITGGFAYGDLQFRQEFPFRPPSNNVQRGDAADANPGWMVGGGLQYALTDHWSVRVQYQFIDLGSVEFDSFFHQAPTFFGHEEAELREHNVSAAIMYKF
ncbi:MAG TPA: outer membrane beta-barrel protein [Chthoniobacterales bacterium]|jgi:outer membrane immunogenic protein|nr:outer membrane beta-barrel protein [Chthoniobacterales bacterium]